jgi:hypothetical protein
MSHGGPLLSHAPELRVAQWIDAMGLARAPLALAELGDGFKVIYCFQHWCAGCHSHGFPALVKLVRALSGADATFGFGFAVVQTVFEGAEANTFERLRETQLRYGLKLPFGHDSPDAAHGTAMVPTVMQDFGTGGTPWFIVINPAGEVVFSDFQIDADRLIADVAGLCTKGKSG